MREIETLDSTYLQINNDTLLGWIVWFCADSNVVQVFNSKEHDWANLPDIGVQFMYRVYDGYLEQVSGTDYYCPYQLMNVEDIRPWIKFGLMIDQTKLNEMFDVVKDYTLENFNNI